MKQILHWLGTHNNNGMIDNRKSLFVCLVFVYEQERWKTTKKSENQGDVLFHN